MPSNSAPASHTQHALDVRSTHAHPEPARGSTARRLKRVGERSGDAFRMVCTPARLAHRARRARRARRFAARPSAPGRVAWFAAAIGVGGVRCLWCKIRCKRRCCAFPRSCSSSFHGRNCRRRRRCRRSGIERTPEAACCCRRPVLLFRPTQSDTGAYRFHRSRRLPRRSRQCQRRRFQSPPRDGRSYHCDHSDSKIVLRIFAVRV